MILQFQFVSNLNVGKLKLINSQCVWNLAGYYDYRKEGVGNILIFTPSTCSSNSDPKVCGECPVMEVNYELVEWEGEKDSCKAFSVGVTRGGGECGGEISVCVGEASCLKKNIK